MDKQFIGHFDNSMLQDVSEFSKRYSNTWIYEEKTKTSFMVEEVLPEKVWLLKTNGNRIEIPIITEKVFSVKPPIIGFFNNDTEFCYGIRIPNRQYKRGICQQNYNAIESIKTLRHNRIILSDLAYTIDYAYKEANCFIQNAIEQLENPKLTGRALNKNFAVSLNTLSPENIYLLWYKNKPVAEIYQNTKTIKVKYKHIKQEILDYNKYIENKQWKII